MFWKKKKESLPLAPSFEFSKAMTFVKDALKYGQYSGDVIAEKIAVLDYILEVIKNDFRYSMLSDVIYKYPNFPIEIWNFMPCAVFDKNGNRIEATDEKSFVKMDSPKKGITFASVYHTEKVFEHMTTDGEKWYNVHTGNALDNVFDFRIALLYEISKIKHGFSVQLKGSENMTKDGTLTDENIKAINAMADFHGITRDKAYEFWREGNFDCLVIDPDEDEDEDEDFEEHE